MNTRLFLVAASVAALCACNSRGGSNEHANAQASGNASGAAPAAPATTQNSSGTAGTGRTAGANPQLEQQIAQAVTMIRPQLPMRQQTPGGTLTISNIEARGTELIYTMEVPTDLDDTKFQQFEQALPQQACANPQARALFEQGGSYTYHLKDPGGEEFSTTIRSC